MAKRREFSTKVKAEIVLRATNAEGRIVCEKCRGVLKRGRKHYEIDHVVAEALVVDKSTKLTAKDGQLLGKCCHRGPDGKTNKDVAVIAEAKRREALHQGFARAKKPFPTRPKPGPRKLDKLPVPGPEFNPIARRFWAVGRSKGD